MKKHNLLILLLLTIIVDVSAEHMKITLKNNTFNISSSCLTPQKYGKGDYECKRKYVIELVSKYNVFENYSVANGWSDYKRGNAVSLETSLYNLNSTTYAPNKSVLYIYLNENELVKLLESNEVKINFSLNLFSDKLLQQELDNRYTRRVREAKRKDGDYVYSYVSRENDVNILKPSITLDFSNVYLNDLKSSCSEEIKECNRKSEPLNSPMNRLKRFFN